MAVKKTKRPALRYLVSADAKLRKLSMKKLAASEQKASRVKRPARSKAAAAPGSESPRRPWTSGPRAMSLAVAGVVVAATLITATQMSDPSGPSRARASEARFVSEPESPAPSTVRGEKSATPAKRASEAAKSSSVKPATAAAVATGAPVTEATADEPVTITGCLVKNRDGFVLKDAAGAALPKTRSWRSGFFKKSLPRLDVLASPAVNLASYDGERVSLTGILGDRELRARSVRRIAASCD